MGNSCNPQFYRHIQMPCFTKYDLVKKSGIMSK